MKKGKLLITTLVSAMLAGCGGGGGGTGNGVTNSVPNAIDVPAEQISDGAVANGTGSNPAQNIGSVVQSNNRNATTGTTTDSVVAAVATNGRVSRIAKTAAAGATGANWNTDNATFGAVSTIRVSSIDTFNRQIIIKTLNATQNLGVLSYSRYENATDWLAGGFWSVTDSTQSNAVVEYGAFVDGSEYTSTLPTSGTANYLGGFAAYYTSATGATVPFNEYTGRAQLAVSFGGGNAHTMSGNFDMLYNQAAGVGPLTGIQFNVGNVNWNNTQRAFIGSGVVNVTCAGGAFSACSDGGDNIAAQFFGTANASNQPNLLGGTFGITDFRVTETVNGTATSHRGNIIGIFGAQRQ